MIINIKNDELIALNGAKSPDFPKYTSQLIMVNAVKVFTLRLCISAYYIHFKRVKVKIFTAFTITGQIRMPKVLVLKLSESFMIYFLSLRMRPMMSLFQNGKNGI